MYGSIQSLLNPTDTPRLLLKWWRWVANLLETRSWDGLEDVVKLHQQRRTDPVMGRGGADDIEDLGKALQDFAVLIRSKLASLPMTASRMKALVFLPLKEGKHETAVSTTAALKMIDRAAD